MSKISWITVTPSLLEGVQLINGVDEKKFPLVLNRIVQSMRNPNDEFCPFTEEEEEKLLSTLVGVENKNDLKTVLDTSAYILLQAAYNITKPAILKSDIIEFLKMNDVKADTFFNIWTTSAKGIVENLRNKSIHSIQLDGLSWMLNVNAASSQKGKGIEPRAVIELKLKQDDDRAGNIIVDMNRTQLYDLYTTLESIQSELDNLR